MTQQNQIIAYVDEKKSETNVKKSSRQTPTKADTDRDSSGK